MDQRSNNTFLPAKIGVRTIPHGLRFGREIIKLFPGRCGYFPLTMDVLLDAQFNLLDSLQGLIPAAFQFVGDQAVLRVRGIVLLLGTLCRIARGFQVSSPGVQDIVLLAGFFFPAVGRPRSSSTTSISRQPNCCKRSRMAYCSF
jgi:hypothetical protein